MILSQEQLDVVDAIDETFFQLWKLCDYMLGYHDLMQTRPEDRDEYLEVLQSVDFRMKQLIADRPDISILLKDNNLTGMEPRLGGGKT